MHRDRGGLAISALPHHSAGYAGRGAATEVKPSEPKKLFGRAMVSARLFASRQGTSVCAARSRADAAASQLYKPYASALPLFPDHGAQSPPELRVKPSECSRERTRLDQDRIKRRAELARQTTSTEARNLASSQKRLSQAFLRFISLRRLRSPAASPFAVTKKPGANSAL